VNLSADERAHLESACAPRMALLRHLRESSARSQEAAEQIARDNKVYGTPAEERSVGSSHL
jgi:hypothetical protein